jgi:hypothetical protein
VLARAIASSFYIVFYIETSMALVLEVEQETQRTSGLEHHVVTDGAEASDQALLGDGLDVLALRSLCETVGHDRSL